MTLTHEDLHDKAKMSVRKAVEIAFRHTGDFEKHEERALDIIDELYRRLKALDEAHTKLICEA